MDFSGFVETESHPLLFREMIRVSDLLFCFSDLHVETQYLSLNFSYLCCTFYFENHNITFSLIIMEIKIGLNLIY